MALTIIAIGKKHETWLVDGIGRFQKRLRAPYDVEWLLLPHSNADGDAARQEESERILLKIKPGCFTILLDERGSLLDSPSFAAVLEKQFVASRPITLVIGGAYGVNRELQQRADLVWSLSPLVFPHQIVRLLLAEQIYRAQQIVLGSAYHHN